MVPINYELLRLIVWTYFLPFICPVDPIQELRPRLCELGCGGGGGGGVLVAILPLLKDYRLIVLTI